MSTSPQTDPANGLNENILRIYSNLPSLLLEISGINIISIEKQDCRLVHTGSDATLCLLSQQDTNDACYVNIHTGSDDSEDTLCTFHPTAVLPVPIPVAFGRHII